MTMGPEPMIRILRMSSRRGTAACLPTSLLLAASPGRGLGGGLRLARGGLLLPPLGLARRRGLIGRGLLGLGGLLRRLGGLLRLGAAAHEPRGQASAGA